MESSMRRLINYSIEHASKSKKKARKRYRDNFKDRRYNQVERNTDWDDWYEDVADEMEELTQPRKHRIKKLHEKINNKPMSRPTKSDTGETKTWKRRRNHEIPEKVLQEIYPEYYVD